MEAFFDAARAANGPREEEGDSRTSDDLPGGLKGEFPKEHEGKTVDQIKEELKTAKGEAKRSLQKAKKLIEQSDRLQGKRGKNSGKKGGGGKKK